MDPNKRWPVTLVAAEEGCCSIPITQRPSDQGRLHADYELEAAKLYPEPAPVIHSSIAEGLCAQYRRIKEHNMKRKNPCAKEA